MEIFVAGGASVYADALPYADRLLLSYVDGDFEGDTLFPEFEESDWQVTVGKTEPTLNWSAISE